MSHISQDRSIAETITLTRKDLEALAEKFAGNERCDISKPQALNMIASEILGPKHDWSWIKKSEGPVTSQRAQSCVPDAPESPEDQKDLHTDLVDVSTGEKLPATAYITANGIEVDIADGTHVWIERNDGIQKIHVYNDLSDGPVSVWAEPMHRITVKHDGYEGDALTNLSKRSIAGTNSKPIIGYQVDRPIDRSNWGDRQSFEILPYEVALNDYLTAQLAGETGDHGYRILPIREGDIEEPEFIEA